MIASQLRFLYYMNRGEFSKAAPHRQQVELHAARVGSAWQVETWETPALILIHTTLNDVVGSTRIAKQLELMSENLPSLRLHAQLAAEALRFVNEDSVFDAKTIVEGLLDSAEPRSFIGWAAVNGYLVRGCNLLGSLETAHGRDGSRWFSEARDRCERLFTHVVDADREYVSMFLVSEIELAVAHAGLGDVDRGLGVVDRLLERFRGVDHPLAQGLLHEGRARIGWEAGRTDVFDKAVLEVERWFRPTANPSLIAKCERLNALRTGAAAESAPLSRIRKQQIAAGGLDVATVVDIPDPTTNAADPTVITDRKG